MQKHHSRTERRYFPLAIIASLGLVLASFEWTAYAFGEPDAVNYGDWTDGLEQEVVPPSVVSRPMPPLLARIAPIIVPDPGPEPTPDPDFFKEPDLDPGFGDWVNADLFGDGENLTDDEIETVLVAEHMPHFADCANVLNPEEERMCTELRMIQIIQGHSAYPRHLLEAGIHGVAHVQFIIDEHGSVLSPECVHSSHSAFGKAAVSAMEALPRMVPASQQGKPVRVMYTIPVRFRTRR